jgi:hypothetical protein
MRGHQQINLHCSQSSQQGDIPSEKIPGEK